MPPRRSTLTLVDLAGSERAAAVAGKPQRLEECKAINASLAALGNCVAALAKGRPHVPYRDSKLTRLLSASLGGAARTSLVAALVPGGDAGGESRSTLEFAGRAARVAVRAAPAEVAVDYEALHAEAAARVDALEERATDLALENERLTVEDDALHAKVRAAEDRADALARRLEAADARLDAARRSRPGQHKRAKFPTSKAPLSAVFHSFRLIFGRAIISRNGLEAWMLFPERARAEHSR